MRIERNVGHVLGIEIVEFRGDRTV